MITLNDILWTTDVKDPSHWAQWAEAASPPPSLPSFLVPKLAARPELAAGKISLGWPSFFQGF